MKEKLGELKRKFGTKFSLSTISDTRWERKRDEFVESMVSLAGQMQEEKTKEQKENLELDERGWYIKKSDMEAGKNLRYCAACYENTGRLYPITQGSLRRDFFCTNCRMHFN